MPIPVAVVVDGTIVESSRTATLERGIVVAPVDPFVRRIASAVTVSRMPDRVRIVRGGTAIVVSIGSTRAYEGTAVETLPIAPFVRGGETIIPLAAIARGLAATVRYDARARVVYVRLPREPLATMTPYVPYAPPNDPVTFAPTSTPQPRATVTGIPRPRRTPILVQPR